MVLNRRNARLETLQDQLRGCLVFEGDDRWNEARAAWNLAIDQRPAAVAFPNAAEEVARIVRTAVGAGLRVAPQTTGHNPGALPDLGNTILIKTGRLVDVTIDFEQRLARAGGGAVWIDVAEPASPHGLAPLAGSAPDVGIAGYTLGGGISWLARKHGVAANSVTSIEVVTADGVVRRANQDENLDLFWGLRGGGGNFGVVTELEFQLHPVTDLYAGWLIWPMADQDRVMNAWREWLSTVPDDVTSILRLLRLPAAPVVPGPLRGRHLVVVEAAILLPESESERLLAPLRSLQPEIDTFARIPPVALSHLHMDPDQPIPAAGDSRQLREFTTETIDAILGSVGAGTDAPLTTVELRHLGGALGRPDPTGGAVSSFDAEYLLFSGGAATDPRTADGIENALETLFDGIEPWATGHRFASFVESAADPHLFYPDHVYQRLARIKTQYDPENVVLANHSIPARSGLRSADRPNLR